MIIVYTFEAFAYLVLILINSQKIWELSHDAGMTRECYVLKQINVFHWNRNDWKLIPSYPENQYYI